LIFISIAAEVLLHRVVSAQECDATEASK